jgi:TPR repeat protein
MVVGGRLFLTFFRLVVSFNFSVLGNANNDRIDPPNQLYLKLLKDFNKKHELSVPQLTVFEKALAGDPSSLNTIGLSLTSDSVFGPKDLPLAASFFRAAADQGHIIASVNLGRAYAEGRGVTQSQVEALRWFKIASSGGHQGAMYNCGLLLSKGTPYAAAAIADDGSLDENGRVPGYFPADPIAALEYFQMAYQVARSPTQANEHLVSAAVTDAAVQAHGAVCDTIAHTTFSTNELSRLWNAASLVDVPESAHALWEQGLGAIVSFNDTFVKMKGIVDDNARRHLSNAAGALGALIDGYSGELSYLQLHLALDNLQEMIGPLAGKDDELAAPAARYAEALAISHYCRGKYAAVETDRAVSTFIFDCLFCTSTR